MIEQNIGNEILQLKKEKDVAILAHYYVDGEVQEIADYVGDSYYLAEKATRITQENILFCGVTFMGESAKILNPQKKVYMADDSADCPMAHMADIEKIREVRREYNDVAVVCYVNSTTEIKAESDVCVTSSNALKIVRALPNKYIYLIPVAKEAQGSMDLTLYLLSLLRIQQPDLLLPATTALATIHPRGRELGIEAGANVVMSNLSPVGVRDKYALYDGKVCTGDEAAECRNCLERRIESVGYHIVVSRGDHCDVKLMDSEVYM